MRHRFILYYQASERTRSYQFNRAVTAEQQWKATCFADKTFCTFVSMPLLHFNPKRIIKMSLKVLYAG